MSVKYDPNPRMLSPAALAKQNRVGVERHVVENINYENDLMSCSCGEWEGPALDTTAFKAHRKAEGIKAR